MRTTATYTSPDAFGVNAEQLDGFNSIFVSSFDILLTKISSKV